MSEWITPFLVVVFMLAIYIIVDAVIVLIRNISSDGRY